jgi:hypothetical protein
MEEMDHNHGAPMGGVEAAPAGKKGNFNHHFHHFEVFLRDPLGFLRRSVKL